MNVWSSRRLRTYYPGNRLLVPWSEIKVRRKKGWVFEYVIFTMGHELAIPLRIRANLAAKLRESAGNCWPVEET